MNLLLRIRVAPRAKRDAIGELVGDRMKVAITASPTDGKANQHLTKMIAKQFQVPPSRVAILVGRTARDKTISIEAPERLPDSFQVAPP